MRDLYIIEVPDHEKMLFRPSKWPQKFGTRKTAKNGKLPKNVLSHLEKVGGHQYPRGS
jgi:hypothetical protein